MSATDGTMFVPVLPDFSKFFSGVEKASKESGDKAGKDFSEAMQDGMDRAERARNKGYCPTAEACRGGGEVRR